MPYEVKEARSSSKANAQGTPALHHMEIHPGANGGHTVTHHAGPRSEAYESHPFSAEEGQHMLGHVAQTLGMTAEEEPNVAGHEQEAPLDARKGRHTAATSAARGMSHVENEGAQEA
jgi:hypothetical protein